MKRIATVVCLVAFMFGASIAIIDDKDIALIPGLIFSVRLPPAKSLIALSASPTNSLWFVNASDTENTPLSPRPAKKYTFSLRFSLNGMLSSCIGVGPAD